MKWYRTGSRSHSWRVVPYLWVVRHHGKHTGIGLAFVAAASAAIERGLVRIVIGGASVGAEQDQPRKIFVSPIMRRAVSTVVCSSRREARSRDALFVAGGGTSVKFVLPAQDLGETRPARPWKARPGRRRPSAADPALQTRTTHWRRLSTSAGVGRRLRSPSRSCRAFRTTACCSAATISTVSAGASLSTVSVVAMAGTNSRYLQAVQRRYSEGKSVLPKMGMP